MQTVRMFTTGIAAGSCSAVERSGSAIRRRSRQRWLAGRCRGVSTAAVAMIKA
ncbi:MAG TPA: hypothetical protein PLA36_00270 [Deltaproteobacteria bacterium]|nr:hypothetical protein [Deltaproteobacteria bacterium]